MCLFRPTSADNGYTYKVRLRATFCKRLPSYMATKKVVSEALTHQETAENSPISKIDIARVRYLLHGSLVRSSADERGMMDASSPKTSTMNRPASGNPLPASRACFSDCPFSLKTTFSG